MLPSLSGSSQQFLADLERMSSQLTEVTQQLSSGYRINSVADDPSAVESMLQYQSQITNFQQVQNNLNNLKPELQTGDAALQQAMQNVETAIQIASESTSPLADANSRNQLVIQVQGILQNLVNLSASTANGRYIFSGDLDQQPLYQVDATQPTGVAQLATANATRSVTDANGVQVWLGKTATEIFDDRNPADGTPANDNVFNAVNTLLVALQNNDPAAAQASIANLKAADGHLNQELGYYGIGEARVDDTLSSITSAMTSVETALSGVRDTDMPSAAMELNQITVQQQAAYSARSKISGMNLFDFLA